MIVEGLGFIETGEFIVETKLMVLCYICDSEGVEVEKFSDYKKLGRCLKIRTEEYYQEKAPKGSRRYTGPDAYLYVYHDFTRYNAIMVSFIANKRLNEASVLQWLQSTNPLKPLVIASDTTSDVIFDESINGNNNSFLVRRTVYRPEYIIPGTPGTPGDPTAVPPVPEVPAVPPENTGTPDPLSLDFHTHLLIVDRFANHDNFKESPLADIDTPDDCRMDSNISELYLERFPSLRYNVDGETGLESALQKIVNEPKLADYDLDYLIIGPHVTSELNTFEPRSAYSISWSSYEKLYKRFKKIEVDNTLVNVILPPGDFSPEKLSLKNCIVMANDTNIKCKTPVEMINCTVANSDLKTGVKYLIINTSTDIEITNLTFSEPVKLIIVANTDGLSITINALTFNCNTTGYTVDSPLLTVSNFTNVKIVNITKTNEAITGNTQLISTKNCIDVKISDFILGVEILKGNLLSITGFNSFSLNNIISDIPNPDGVLCNLSSSGPEATIKISLIKTSLKRLCTIVGCDISKINISDCTLNLIEFINTLNSKITTTKVNTCDLTFKNKLVYSFDSLSFDKCNINGTDLDLSSKQNFVLVNSSITCTNLQIRLQNISKLSSNESTFNVSKLFNIDGVDNENNASKIDFVKTNMDGGQMVLSNIDFVSFNFSFIIMEHLKVFNSKVFDSVENTVRVNKCKKISLINVSSVKNSVYYLENGGNIEFITEKCIGKFNFTINSDINMKRKSTNCRLADIFKNDNNNKLSLSIDSNGSKSSAYIIDKSLVSISPLCSDFKLFKYTPANFLINTAGKELYENIYYGLIVKK